MNGDQPTVTIAIPAFNEERNLGRTLESVAAQSYDSIVEVIVADGGSTDRTRFVAEQVPGTRVIDNPGRIQAVGLNRIVEIATGEIIVRVDAHCELPRDYVQNCVRALAQTDAAMVGGSMVPVAASGMGRAVAAAMRSRVGAGPARFHRGGEAGWVDTVYLGAYATDLARVVGGYDETLATNEDAEFAIRMARRGGIWFDPSIRAFYTPRASVREVAQQFYRYGVGRAATIRRHPTCVKARQFAAPAFLLGLASPWRKQVGAAYLGVLAIGSLQARDEGIGVVARVPAVLTAMHLSWGIGLLVGAVNSITTSQSRRDALPPEQPR